MLHSSQALLHRNRASLKLLEGALHVGRGGHGEVSAPSSRRRRAESLAHRTPCRQALGRRPRCSQSAGRWKHRTLRCCCQPKSFFSLSWRTLSRGRTAWRNKECARERVENSFVKIKFPDRSMAQNLRQCFQKGRVTVPRASLRADRPTSWRVVPFLRLGPETQNLAIFG